MRWCGAGVPAAATVPHRRTSLVICREGGGGPKSKSADIYNRVGHHSRKKGGARTLPFFKAVRRPNGQLLRGLIYDAVKSACDVFSNLIVTCASPILLPSLPPSIPPFPPSRVSPRHLHARDRPQVDEVARFSFELIIIYLIVLLLGCCCQFGIIGMIARLCVVVKRSVLPLGQYIDRTPHTKPRAILSPRRSRIRRERRRACGENGRSERKARSRVGKCQANHARGLPYPKPHTHAAYTATSLPFR